MAKEKCLIIPTESIVRFDRYRNQIVLRLTGAHTATIDLTKLPASVKPYKESDLV
jgi:hypothetical protein